MKHTKSSAKGKADQQLARSGPHDPKKLPDYNKLLQKNADEIADLAERGQSDLPGHALPFAIEFQGAAIATDAILLDAASSRNAKTPEQQKDLEVEKQLLENDRHKRQAWIQAHPLQGGTAGADTGHLGDSGHPAANSAVDQRATPARGTGVVLPDRGGKQKDGNGTSTASKTSTKPGEGETGRGTISSPIADYLPAATASLFSFVTAGMIFLTWQRLGTTERLLTETGLTIRMGNLKQGALKAREKYVALAERLPVQSEASALPAQDDFEPVRSVAETSTLAQETLIQSTSLPLLPERPPTLVDAYNRVRSADDLKQIDQFEQQYEPRRISCKNLDDFRSDPNAILKFEPSSYGNFLAVAIDTTEVNGFPAFNVDLSSQRTAISGVFLYPDNGSGSLRVGEPAVLQPDGEGWILKRRGELKANA